jgi:protein-L-isoaspartate(D-aspartate) O-methyltransferase
MEHPEWPQYVIDFPDRRSAEKVAGEYLRPELDALQGAGEIGSWSFIRKTPSWRLRYPPEHERAAARLTQLLDGLLTDGRITNWTVGIYEPEVYAFGGTAGLDVAHELACRDSNNILEYLADGAASGKVQRSLGRREVALLWCSVLLRSAGQDWYEQGDIWARVAEHRPTEQTFLQVGDLDG